MQQVAVQKRCLNLQEFQSKGLMDKYGVRTQKWIVASTVEEAVERSKANLSMWAIEFCIVLFTFTDGEFTVIFIAHIHPDAKELVVKAQVLAGGRGKGHFTNGFKGGVHLCNTYVCEVCKLKM